MVFSCEFCEIFKNIFLTKYLGLTISGIAKFKIFDEKETLFILQFDLPCGFSKKMYLLKRGWNPGFLIIISHIFPENFTEIPQVFQKTWRLSLLTLAIFIDFHRFFNFFWHFLVTKKQWCQHFFTFNLLTLNRLLYKVILILDWCFFEIWNSSNWSPHQKSYPLNA